MADALKDSLCRKQLRLVFQPQFTLSGEYQLVGAEALLRWHHHELGNVSPADFIPLAEQSSLIVKVDKYVCFKLIEHVQAWRESGVPVSDLPIMAFNLSPRTLCEPGFAAELVREIDRTHIPPSLLQAEITEREPLHKDKETRINLEILRRKGIGLSIDDFGTGYSCLAYLKEKTVSEIKIDQGFVQGLGQTQIDETIVRSILTLGQTLNIRIVGEGIETLDQLEWLRTAHCPIGQGYLLSRPLEQRDFEELLQKYTHLHVR
ncbi:EAL domain-containing protein [Azospirillum agricola]|uniref:EAL domain-containing protein n=1 Tax=Azospirillum agricola TaxID=1720247 RepID=UPI001B3BFDA1|nr:EAL domain-containing protein [Azospirillum agricola]